MTSPHSSGARENESMSHSDNPVQERQHAAHRPSHAPHRSGENQRIPEDPQRDWNGYGIRQEGARQTHRKSAEEVLIQYEDAPDEARVAAFGSCCVCMANPADVVMSCGHLCICQNCVRHVERCPICRAQQQGKPLKCVLNQALAPANPYTIAV
jgi:hypothetical protein